MSTSAEAGIPAANSGNSAATNPAVQRFMAYGTWFNLVADPPTLFALACAALPLGWSPAPDREQDSSTCYALSISMAPDHTYRLVINSELVGCYQTSDQLCVNLTHHAELLMAEMAQDCLFIHCGVVGWQGQAILIPGRSFSGKTTLVKALVEAGATYYSDEFALLDSHGLAYPYPRPLALRDSHGQPLPPISAESLGGRAGTDPLPVGLVVVTQYKALAAWYPQTISPALALLALMDNTVAARRNPAHSMPILRQVVVNARTLQGSRGEAASTAAALLADFGPPGAG